MGGVGALLMLLATGFAVGFLGTDGTKAEIAFYGLALPPMTARALIIVGLAAGLIFGIGLEALRWGVARWMRRRDTDPSNDT